MNRKRWNIYSFVLLFSICFLAGILLAVAYRQYKEGSEQENESNIMDEAMQNDSSSEANSGDKKAADILKKIGWLTIEDEIDVADSETDEGQSGELDDAADQDSENAEEIKEDPAQVLAGGIYSSGMKERADDYYNKFTAEYPDIEDDLVRFSLWDVDKDMIPELIMHDVTGNSAYLCAYYDGEISEPLRIYDNSCPSDDFNMNYGAYASMYEDSDIVVIYEFSNDYEESGYGGIGQVLIPEHDYTQKIKTSFLRLNKKTMSLDPVDQVIAVGNFSSGEFNYEFADGEGQDITESEYRESFREAIGDDNYRHFFIEDTMMADSEFDFRAEFLWNGGTDMIHMTKEELFERIDSLSGN